MKKSPFVCALALTLTLGSFSANSQGRVRDPNASNNPEIYQQTHPEDTSGRNLQGAPISRGERRELERREGDRGEIERREAQRQEAQRREADRRGGAQREFERRESERRDLVQREAERREAARRENGRHGHDRRDQIQHGHGRRDQIQHGQDWRDHNRQNHGWRDHDRQSHQWRDHHRAERYYYGARGPEFRRGGYIPYEYRARQYWVNDWHGHGLSAPPYGHHWVQIGPDYALIAIATGLIAYLVVNQ